MKKLTVRIACSGDIAEDLGHGVSKSNYGLVNTIIDGLLGAKMAGDVGG